MMDFRNSILPHRDRLYRLALNITMNIAEAEDVVQDTMLRAWERRAEWESIGNMQAWLTQICKNLSLDKRRHQKYQQPLTDESHEAEAAQHDDKESVAILHNLINQLPPPFDDLIRLRDIEGLSYHDIATQLSLSDEQVKVYLHRARQKLKEKYLQLQRFGL
ncbi:MAG: RNA polymerase sigma factor [Bacteroidaceae bacterium]|nr:RNA polymerase sigma factor [Bacteroidaceae bacterium]